VLIGLLDDRSPVQQAALESLAAIHGPLAITAGGASATAGDRVAQWKQWHAGQMRRG
jgi:hypothetical protein